MTPIPRHAWPHLFALVLPVATLIFVATGPHGGWGLLAIFALSLVLLVVDPRVRVERAASPPGWRFDAIVYVIAALQLVTVALFLRGVAISGWSVDLVAGAILVGNNSGWGAIVIAHELIHRRGWLPRLVGRVLLGNVLYDHFYVEHLRGHHVRVATAEDPATARYGERYWPFLWRSVTGQLRSAWQIDRRSTLAGLLAQALMLGVIGHRFGAAVLVAFLWQAFTAIGLLEAVNYFEHWGLTRLKPRRRGAESWDTDCWVTRYGLVGLALHADHHAHPQRHYQELEPSVDAPRLPFGYPRMVWMAQAQNDKFQQVMTRELQRCHLGPFSSDTSSAGA